MELRYAHLATAFQDGTILGGQHPPLVIKVIPIGALTIVSGEIVACDPIAAGRAGIAFTAAVPIGAHPVLLSVALSANGARSVACAMVRFTANTPVRWEMAKVKDSDDSTLGSGAYFGYCVDSGTGCFMDAALAPAELPTDTSSASYEALLDEEEDRMVTILEQMRRTKPGWANTVLDSTTGANIVAFSTGYGDGVYESFFGYDAQDQLVCLVTDFSILPS